MIFFAIKLCAFHKKKKKTSKINRQAGCLICEQAGNFSGRGLAKKQKAGTFRLHRVTKHYKRSRPSKNQARTKE